MQNKLITLIIILFMPALTFGQSFLNENKNIKPMIISPHPDDETLCCSTILRKHKSSIVFLTNGDGYNPFDHSASKKYGQQRLKEVRKVLSLTHKNHSYYYLGFPDGHLSELNKTPLISKYTGQSSPLPSAYNSGALYTYQHLYDLLMEIIKQEQPTHIYIPSSTKDLHPDHQLAGTIVETLVPNLVQRPIIEYYAIHGNFEKTPQKTDYLKLRMIKRFKSQFHDNHHRQFLESFSRIKEIFWQKK